MRIYEQEEEPVAVQVGALLGIPCEKVRVTIAPTDDESLGYTEVLVQDDKGEWIDPPLDKKTSMETWVRSRSRRISR